MTRLVCWLLGHRFFAIRRLSDHAQQVGCSRCRGLWAINHQVRALLPWDAEFEAFYIPGGILAPEHFEG